MPGTPALPIDRIAALQTYLLKLLPGLASTEFLPALVRPQRGDDAPAALATTLAWLTAHLQNLGNACVSDVAIAHTANGDVLSLSAYQVPEVATQALQLAATLIAAGCEARVPGATPENAPPGVNRNLAEFLRFAQSWHLEVVTHSIVSAAHARNIPHYRLCSSARFIQLGQGVHLQHIYETVSDRTSEAGAKIAHNKIATHHLLRKLGLPTAEQIPVATIEQAAAAAAQLGYPVVVKPSHGLQTLGVTVGVRNRQELHAAFQAAAEARLGSILVENFVPGDHHRLLVIGGRLTATVKWILPHVVGDGVSTVEQLLAIANRDSRRGNADGYAYEFGRQWVRMAPNPEMKRMLGAQGYDYSSIPPRGQTVRLHGTLTLASGGDGVDVTDKVHADVREMAEFIAQAFRLDTVGIDYLSEDITRTYRNGGGAVCEVNACPGLRGHFLIGSDRNKILAALLQRDFPAGQTGRVPTVAIAGSPGAPAVARMVAHILESSGLTTALAFASGVYVGGAQMRDGDSSGGERARAVMMDPRVEAAVLELGSRGLLETGMPVDICDVGAVLDVEFDSARQDGVDSRDMLSALKSLVPRAATRFAVLNADDAHCVRMAADLQHAAICWVSTSPDNPVLRKHAGTGMTAALAGTGKKAEIVITLGPQRQCVIPVRDAPARSSHAVEALFAAAIACALDIPCEKIGTALGSFGREKN